MIEVELGFRAFDAHELLCHLLAERIGLYREAGVRVRLADLTFRDDDALQTSCGAALLGRLGGRPLKVVLVASARPLFWIVGAPGTQLGGARIAGYPTGSPPAVFLRILLRRSGLDPDADVDVEPARDDAARLGLLRAGAVDAALLGSAVAPARPARLGLAVLAFIGDLAVPTTGLAAPEALLEERPELVAAVAGAHRRALAVVHGSAGPTLAALRELGEGPRQLLAAVRSSFTRDGTVGAAEAQGAVELVAAELREAPFPAAELYDFL